MNSRPYDILVAGEINPDLILTHPDFPLRFEQEEILLEGAAMDIGSSNAIFACGAARLGLHVALVGVVGEDVFGRFMLQALAGRGVDVSHVIIDPTQKTGFSVILNCGERRAILTYLGAINALHAGQIPVDLLAQARHLHVASYFLQSALQPGLPDLFRRAQRLGLTTSLDTNWDPAEEWRGVQELLELTNLFLPNENEALALTGATAPEKAARMLAMRSETVAVKLGAAGALACRGQDLARAPSLPVQVADTVGAGDSFDAGFIYAFLQGWSLQRCARLGAACGSLSTRLHGGTTAQPTLEEALHAIS
jgi:sugar/nucleoside kinase (ribokinase family)